MKLTRPMLDHCVRIEIKDLVRKDKGQYKAVRARSFTVYETSVAEVLDIFKKAMEAHAEDGKTSPGWSDPTGQGIEGGRGALLEKHLQQKEDIARIQSPPKSDEFWAMTPYKHGLQAWWMYTPRALSRRFPVRGQQGFFDVDVEAAGGLQFQPREVAANG